MKKDFFFRGCIAPSKSLMNRLLVCQSFQPDLIIAGDSYCDDVQLMRQALGLLAQRPSTADRPLVLDCGAAGTVLRFLALRLSRLVGQFELVASERLWQRDLGTLQALLAQVGASSRFDQKRLYLDCRGWPPSMGPLHCSAHLSSQYLSGLLLNAWELPFGLELSWEALPSAAYFHMTYQLVRALGMELGLLASNTHRLYLAPGQRPRGQQVVPESDLSSAFAIAALAAIAGEAHFEQFPVASWQPDQVFVEILAQMGAEVVLDQAAGHLLVRRGKSLLPINWDLGNCPDLFPVLGVLCSFASGTSVLSGAPHLKLKESDRIEKTAELLALMGKNFERRSDGLVIMGSTDLQRAPVCFDPGDDHRMVFAAELFNWQGGNLTILRPQVVEKSFPEYWQIVEATHD